MDQLSQSIDGLDAAMRAYKDVGIRATVAPMISDRTYYQTVPVSENLIPEWEKGKKAKSASELIDMILVFLKNWHGQDNRLYVGFGPSGPQRSSEELLKGCMKYALEYQTLFHTHVLETQTQRNTAHLFYGQPMVKYLNDIGCLNRHTSMAHGIWLTKEEALLAKEKGATLAHCPVCNLYLGSGIAAVNLYKENDWLPALGTDGSNGGGNQNLLETMKFAALLHKVTEVNHHKWINAAEVFKMATKQGARLLMQEDRIGSLEVGKDGDIVLLNPKKSCSLLPQQDLICQIVYGEVGDSVDTVLVKGRVVLKNRKCTLVDEERMFEKAEYLASKLAEKILADYPKVNKEIEYLESVLPRIS